MESILIKAIKKAEKEYPEDLIWAVKHFPETYYSPEQIVVFGGCSEKQWTKAVAKRNAQDGINHYRLVVYQVDNLNS